MLENELGLPRVVRVWIFNQITVAHVSDMEQQSVSGWTGFNIPSRDDVTVTQDIDHYINIGKQYLKVSQLMSLGRAEPFLINYS